MKIIILMLAITVLSGGAVAYPDSADDTTAGILAIERQSLDGWIKGNPDALIAVSDPGITYFHTVAGRRLDGLPAVKELFEKYRGQPLYDSYEILDPKVQSSGDTAILTYRFVPHNGTATSLWNSTQVYQKKKEGWRVIHSHWSKIDPPDSASVRP